MTQRVTGQRFRQRKLSTKQNIPVLREHEVEKLDDDEASRHIPKVETGVEKGEEIVSLPTSRFRHSLKCSHGNALSLYSIICINSPLASKCALAYRLNRSTICKPSSLPRRQQPRALLAERLLNCTSRHQKQSQVTSSTMSCTQSTLRNLQPTSDSLLQSKTLQDARIA